MKKILSMILAIMTVVSMFAGCSEREKPEEENNENEIVVQSLQESFTAIIYDSGEDEDFWKAVKSAFESENEGVTVNMIVTKDAAYEVRDRILEGNSPDFIYLPSDEESGVTEALVKDKALVEIGEIESFAPNGTFENNICKPYGDGKAYLAPLFFEIGGLIYNKELLSENGFSVPNTWDDFISIAEACKDKDFSFFSYAGAEPDEFVKIFTAALVPVIGVDETNKLLSCDEEAWKNENVNAFAEKVEKIVKLVVSGSSTKTKDDVLECLKEGEALFISGTDTDLKELNKDGEKYAICAYPSLAGAPVQTVSFSEMYIPVEAEKPELAKAFMSFLYGETAANLAKEILGKSFPESGATAVSPKFMVKSAANETLSDEFCALVVDIFKGDIEAKEFGEKMIEYIKEY